MEKSTQASESGKELIIQANGLSKKFKHEIAVDTIDLAIPNGSIFGFIGPSGCGKTTTVRLLTGIYEPSNGELSVLGVYPPDFRRRDRERIGYLPQLFVLYPDLTVWENLNFAASLYGVSLKRQDRLYELLEFVELSAHKKKLVRDISGGMRRRLSLAATLIHDPQLIFLDEPTAGIDPILRRKFWEYFKEMQANQRTLFITTQYVNEAAYCDLVGIMSEGRLLTVNTPHQLRRDAFGGDMIRLRTSDRIEYKVRQQYQELPFVKGEIATVGDNEIQIIVEKAKTATPALIEHSHHLGRNILSIEEYLPPFDEVFVKLIEKYNHHE
jgi:ABC-2 type transport system ATP-binding protein